MIFCGVDNSFEILHEFRRILTIVNITCTDYGIQMVGEMTFD